MPAPATASDDRPGPLTGQGHPVTYRYLCMPITSEHDVRGARPVVSRRQFLTRIAPAAALGLATAACSTAASPHPAGATRALAVVYRGPASAPGCAEAVAALLGSSPSYFRTAYCGPEEDLPLTGATLDGAALYAQPGGGDDLESAWDAVRPFADALRTWVRGGGRYVGFCMGGFLAGSDPGFALLPGDSGEYIASPGATVHDDGDALVDVTWRDTRRAVYFQGGPDFTISSGRQATVVARYPNGSDRRPGRPVRRGTGRRDRPAPGGAGLLVSRGGPDRAPPPPLRHRPRSRAGDHGPVTPWEGGSRAGGPESPPPRYGSGGSISVPVIERRSTTCILQLAPYTRLVGHGPRGRPESTSASDLVIRVRCSRAPTSTARHPSE